MSKGPNHTLMFLAIVGAFAGGIVAKEYLDPAVLKDVVEYGSFPLGQIFLNLLFMLAVPVIFSALIVGVGELDLGSLGRVGLKALAFTVIASSIAVAIGLIAVNAFEPGAGHTELREVAAKLAEERGKDMTKAPDKTGMQLIVAMVPKNPIEAAATGDMLGLMVFALIFGVGLARVRTPGADTLRGAISGLNDVSMHLLGGIIKLAPVGVAALIFTTMATVGIEVIERIGVYVLVVIGALAFHGLFTYSLMLGVIGRRSPLRWFRSVRLAATTAFATASSNATLPVSLEVAEHELKLPRQIGRFVLTAGAAMNQNGTALFEGVTVLFLAQLFGVPLTLGEQGTIMVICILGGIGTAGIPGGSLPVIAMILAMFEIPPSGLALILGVDRLLDMCRTTLNVVGDLVIATCVADSEARRLRDDSALTRAV